ncbi:MAG: hypothetical protein H7296_07385 [Bacteroidia bacterium]|nr:hypothetical protein [Bacteroidia bacterium]
MEETSITHIAHTNANMVLGNVYFSRELFVEMINEIEKQYEYDRKCSDAFKVILPNDYVSNYDNHWLQNQLLKVLQIAMNDNDKNSWIEYYLWELDFGKKYKVGCASNKDGSPIDLSDAGRLWDYLNVA